MKRPREFWTADGFVLMYDETTNEWTDGDQVFDARQPDLWPIDSEKVPLAGKFINENG